VVREFPIAKITMARSGSVQKRPQLQYHNGGRGLRKEEWYRNTLFRDASWRQDYDAERNRNWSCSPAGMVGASRQSRKASR